MATKAEIIEDIQYKIRKTDPKSRLIINHILYDLKLSDLRKLNKHLKVLPDGRVDITGCILDDADLLYDAEELYKNIK